MLSSLVCRTLVFIWNLESVQFDSKKIQYESQCPIRFAMCPFWFEKCSIRLKMVYHRGLAIIKAMPSLWTSVGLWARTCLLRFLGKHNAPNLKHTVLVPFNPDSFCVSSLLCTSRYSYHNLKIQEGRDEGPKFWSQPVLLGCIEKSSWTQWTCDSKRSCSDRFVFLSTQVSSKGFPCDKYFFREILLRMMSEAVH